MACYTAAKKLTNDISCICRADATFVTSKTRLAKAHKLGRQAKYYLQKAFDTVECSTLLKHLFNAGINGKA